MFGLNLIARYYLVLILKIELVDRSEQYDHDGYQQVQQVVTGLMQQNPDTFLLKRDWGDLILIMKGKLRNIWKKSTMYFWMKFTGRSPRPVTRSRSA